MTYQTSEPARRLPLNNSARAVEGLVQQLNEGDMTYDLPYQRGDAWTTEQRMLLIYSVLTGTPLPAIIINERPDSAWFAADGSRLPIYAVIDGKQRLTAFRMFMGGELAVPASWFPADQVAVVEATDDGPYVRWRGLTRPARLFFGNRPVPTSEGSVPTVEAEAEIYLRVNGAGTPQTAGDMARAARVAAGGSRQSRAPGMMAG